MLAAACSCCWRHTYTDALFCPDWTYRETRTMRAQRNMQSESFSLGRESKPEARRVAHPPILPAMRLPHARACSWGPFPKKDRFVSAVGSQASIRAFGWQSPSAMSRTGNIEQELGQVE